MTETIGVAVIGAGMAGQTHMLAFAEAKRLLAHSIAPIRLVAVADVNLPLAEKAAKEHEFETVVDDWRAIADNDDIQVVSVVVANRLHREIVIGLLEAGKNVLCEKPLADTLEDAEAMVEAANRSSAIARIGFTYLRAPGVNAIQRAIHDGTLGRVRHFAGKYWCDYANDHLAPINWRYKGGPGTGVLADIGSHLVYIAESVCGPIESVVGAQFLTAVTERPVPAGATVGHARTEVTGDYEAVENEDLASFAASFSEAVGVFDVSRIASGNPNSLAFEVYCERGAARFHEDRPNEVEFFFEDSRDDGWVTRSYSGPDPESGLPNPSGAGIDHTDDFIYQAMAFLQEIAGVPAETSFGRNATFDDGERNMILLDAIVESAENDGRKVTL